MTTTALANTSVAVSVSDPFEFGTECGDRPFSGTIVDATPDAVLVRLDKPLKYQGKTLLAAVVRPRHAGDSTAQLQSEGKLFANILFLARDVATLAGLSAKEEGVPAIGTTTVP
jgi:hypothetical protein